MADYNFFFLVIAALGKNILLLTSCHQRKVNQKNLEQAVIAIDIHLEFQAEDPRFHSRHLWVFAD